MSNPAEEASATVFMSGSHVATVIVHQSLLTFRCNFTYFHQCPVLYVRCFVHSQNQLHQLVRATKSLSLCCCTGYSREDLIPSTKYNLYANSIINFLSTNAFVQCLCWVSITVNETHFLMFSKVPYLSEAASKHPIESAACIIHCSCKFSCMLVTALQ